MSNNFNITIYDFTSICRTCLSRKDLKPLYDKCFPSTNLINMLMGFTVVKFTENDGLPVKICANCINEINQAFSFAKRCEKTDAILRNCVTMQCNIKHANNSGQSIKVEPIIQTTEEMQIEINPEIILANMHQAVDADSVDFEHVEVKQEVKQWDKIDYPADESFEEYDDENQDETYSEKSHNRGSQSKVKFRKLIDTNEQSPVCSVCGKIFTASSNLKCHMRIHTGEKPYACAICSKAFTRRSEMKYHMRIHTGEKPYSCEVCTKTFSQSKGLKYHMRLHTGEKPYSCEVCSKAFTEYNSLKYHIRKHTGEKPYSCDVCGKSFSRHRILTVHKRIHMEKT